MHFITNSNPSLSNLLYKLCTMQFCNFLKFSGLEHNIMILLYNVILSNAPIILYFSKISEEILDSDIAFLMFSLHCLSESLLQTAQCLPQAISTNLILKVKQLCTPKRKNWGTTTKMWSLKFSTMHQMKFWKSERTRFPFSAAEKKLENLH